MIINLTPHKITVVLDNREITFPPSGEVARVSTCLTKSHEIQGIPVFRTTFGEVVGLPDESPDVTYVVSALVRTHPDLVGRKDLVSPGELIRDDMGVIVGCKGFAV